MPRTILLREGEALGIGIRVRDVLMVQTGAMWIVVRLIAVAALAAGGVLLAGHGTWLLVTLDSFAAKFRAGPVMAGRETPLEWPVAAGGLLVGLAAASWPPAARLVSHLTTLLHELGHVVVAAALGGRPSGIVLRHDASGHARTRWLGRATPLRRFAIATVAFSGRLAPPAAAAVGAQLTLVAGPRGVLWSLTAAAVVVTILARSPWSLLVALALAAVAATALTDAMAPASAGAVVALLGGIALSSIYDQVRVLRSRVVAGDDAVVVARELRLPVRLTRLCQVTVAMSLAVWTLWLLLSSLPGST